MGRSRPPIMAIPTSAGLRAGLPGCLLSAAIPLALLAAVVAPSAAPSLAQGVTPNQPLAIESAPGLSPPPYRLLVPRFTFSELQLVHEAVAGDEFSRFAFRRAM